VISGNATNGVTIDGSLTHDNVVAGNYIGLNLTGSAAVKNGVDGVQIVNGATANTIGGTAAGAANVIGGHTASSAAAVDIIGSSNNVVRGNRIGTNASGTAAIANYFGV